MWTIRGICHGKHYASMDQLKKISSLRSTIAFSIMPLSNLTVYKTIIVACIARPFEMFAFPLTAVSIIKLTGISFQFSDILWLDACSQTLWTIYPYKMPSYHDIESNIFTVLFLIDELMDSGWYGFRVEHH